MSEKLRECPFCGEPAVLCEDEESESSQYFVRCSSFMCGCSIESHILPYGASNYWNHRPTEDRLREENERLRNDLMDALDVKNGNGPTALSAVVADRDAIRKHNKHLSTFLEEAAHAAATGKDPAKYLATSIPTELRDEITALRQRVRELEGASNED